MELKEAQLKIREFDEARGWGDSWNLKDLSLNITEEIGEFWNLIKWVDVEEQKKILEKNKEEISDFIGDTLFLVLKMANQMGVDVNKALEETLLEYKKRMPSDKMKEVKHANKLSGGFDQKE